MTLRRERPLVLVIDDIAPVVRVIQLELELHGFDVVGLEITERVYRAIEEMLPDIIVFEVFLPQLNGPELLRGIRERWDTPVIFLTTSDNESDKEEAARLGANDYIVKPFDPAELTYRISALLRMPPLRSHILRTGDLEIDFSRRKARRGETSVMPNSTEWPILFALARRPGETVSVSDILTQVWGLEGLINRANLIEIMTRLRQRLGDDPYEPKIIVGDMDSGFALQAKEIENPPEIGPREQQ